MGTGAAVPASLVQALGPGGLGVVLGWALWEAHRGGPSCGHTLTPARPPLPVLLVPRGRGPRILVTAGEVGKGPLREAGLLGRLKCRGRSVWD